MARGYVIGLASLPGAGKEGIAQSFIKLGVEHIHIGTVVRETAKENGFTPKDNSREAYIPFWGEFAKENGEDWLAKLAINKAANSGSTILLDGVRIPADAEMITNISNGSMVWLEGSLPILAKRVINRSRDDDTGLTESEYISKMQKDMADEGHFSMGAVKNASELFLLPVPEIQNLDERSAYYLRLANHILEICGSREI